MDVADYIDHLRTEGTRLGDVAASAPLDSVVPAIGWTLDELVRHTGGVHRWCEELVAGRASELDTSGELIDAGPPDPELIDWYRAGLAALVTTLRDAPAGLQVPTLLRTDDAVAFWARRQAHETGIHRADAQAAVAAPTGFDGAFARDGIEELLLGFGRGRPFAVPEPGTLALAASDGPSWLITFGGERNDCAVSDDLARADATVRGNSSELYRWVWNRPADVVLDGDAEVAGRWAAKVRIRRS